LELSDSQIINALLTGSVQPGRLTTRTAKMVPARTVTATLSKLPQRQRCACKQCHQCVENQRWEAIYNAKFADPDYYKARPVRRSSSLSWGR
jgi:hypothetical protein